jgi:hypothetical protein
MCRHRRPESKETRYGDEALRQADRKANQPRHSHNSVAETNTFHEINLWNPLFRLPYITSSMFAGGSSSHPTHLLTATNLRCVVWLEKRESFFGARYKRSLPLFLTGRKPISASRVAIRGVESGKLGSGRCTTLVDERIAGLTWVVPLFYERRNLGAGNFSILRATTKRRNSNKTPWWDLCHFGALLIHFLLIISA